MNRIALPHQVLITVVSPLELLDMRAWIWQCTRALCGDWHRAKLLHKVQLRKNFGQICACIQILMKGKIKEHT